jgi:hypothetical protein
VTTKEQLHELVEHMSDAEAAALLAFARAQLGEDEPAEEFPAFFGMLHSGKGDLGARSSEILRAEFGRSARMPDGQDECDLGASR